MKKYLPYIIIILLLGGASVWFILKKTAGTTELGEKAFAVENTKDITKIILTDADKKHIELTDSNGVWHVNGRYVARGELIQSLLGTLRLVRILSPVARAARDNVVRQLLVQNIRVEVFTGNETEPVKVFYVGGPTPNETGTYMLLEQDGKPMERPYVTYIPGFRGYLTSRFNTDEENWRSRILFNYNESDIQSLSLEYTGDGEKSFSINRLSKDSFDLSPKEEKLAIHQHYEQKYIRQYLDFYSDVSIEAFNNDNTAKDSVMQTLPYCIFTITGKDKSVNTVKLFYMPLSKRSKMQYDAQGNLMTYDVDHFYVVLHNNKDFAIAQYYVLGKLLRSYKDFFFKPTP